MKAVCLCRIPHLKRHGKYLVTNDGISSRSGALGGGMAGAILFAMFHSLFDSAGAMVAGVLLFLIGIILLTGKALVPYVAEHFPQYLKSIKGAFAKKEQKKTQTAQKTNPKTRAARTKSRGKASKEESEVETADSRAASRGSRFTTNHFRVY